MNIRIKPILTAAPPVLGLVVFFVAAPAAMADAFCAQFTKEAECRGKVIYKDHRGRGGTGCSWFKNKCVPGSQEASIRKGRAAPAQAQRDGQGSARQVQRGVTSKTESFASTTGSE